MGFMAHKEKYAEVFARSERVLQRAARRVQQVTEEQPPKASLRERFSQLLTRFRKEVVLQKKITGTPRGQLLNVLSAAHLLKIDSGPQDAMNALKFIKNDIRLIEQQLWNNPEQEVAFVRSEDIQRLVGRYLPELLAAYGRAPASPEVDERFCRSLTNVNAAIRDHYDALRREDADRFDLTQGFIEARYGESGLGAKN